MRLAIYVEGGGTRKDLRSRCREAFSYMFKRAGYSGKMPSVVACGSRNDTFTRFRGAVKLAQPDVLPVLLVDSENRINRGQPIWEFLTSSDHWDKPAGITEEQTFLMVQCMEAWFLADREALQKFFGNKIKLNKLPGQSDPEQINKEDVLDGLKQATKDCANKYSKGKISFQILGMIDASKLRKLHFAGQFFDMLDRHCA